jgi:iron complex transport system substrate-binding protein
MGLLWLLALLLLGACGAATDAPDAATEPIPTAPAVVEVVPPASNLSEQCVETYDPEIDYFPDKASIEYAEGWTIEYFDHYKVITVLNPWREADVTFQYVLVQCGTPTPDGYDDAQVIEIPTDTMISMSTAYLPHFAELGLVDRLVGVDSFAFVYTPEIVERIEAGEVAEVGGGAQLNVERVLALDPDLVMTYGIGDPQSDVHPRLIDAGVPVVINAEYMETGPLGRAEWIKFTAAFANREAAAAPIFANIATQYETLAEQARAAEDRPSVFVNAPFQGTWYMPGGNSYPAQLLADAGADYLWSEDDTTGGLPLSFETVLERAADADYWLRPGDASSLEELLAQDERFASFEAVQQGNVYNNNRRLSAGGGNDYWETGLSNPHLLLADLIAILHPELLPEHELLFYQQLD